MCLILYVGKKVFSVTYFSHILVGGGSEYLRIPSYSLTLNDCVIMRECVSE